MLHRSRKSKGFTLIELLIVIAVIGILASTLIVSVRNGAARARDARKLVDLRNIQVALRGFYAEFGRMPTNYVAGQGACDTGFNPGAYQSTMQDLINAGYLSSIPKSPGGGEGGGTYCYYDYGAGNTMGAFFKTFLEAIENTVDGVPPSCRPWAAGTNWCDRRSSKEYCICMPY